MPPPATALCDSTRRVMFSATQSSALRVSVAPRWTPSSRRTFGRRSFHGLESSLSRAGRISPAARTAAATRSPSRDADAPVATAALVRTRRFEISTDRAARVRTRAANWPGLADADDAPRGGRGGGASKPARARKSGRGSRGEKSKPPGDSRRDRDEGSSGRTRRGGSKGGRGGRGGSKGGRGGSRGGSRGGGASRDAAVGIPTAPSDGSTAWRLFGVTLSLAEDPGKDSFEVTDAIRDAAARALGLPHLAGKRADGSHLLRDGDGYGVRLVRKSCDARKRNAPVFKYVVDVDDVCVNSAVVATGEIKPPVIARAPKRRERAPPRLRDDDDLEETDDDDDVSVSFDGTSDESSASLRDDDDRVVIVGLGPCGLFAALALTEQGVPVTVLERGQPVESRGRDIGALFARRRLNEDSNLCYGEGGAGTWSDGKLTTRIGRNGEDVRSVLRALVAFGAPEGILVAGKPHLGTDRLVRILRNAREYLTVNGAEILFGRTVERVVFEDDEAEPEAANAVNAAAGTRTKRVVGVWTVPNREPTAETSGDDDANKKPSPSFLRASRVVLASGHSARGLFEEMHGDGIALEYQSFAAGFRIEHPQALLDALQYGSELAPLAARGKGPLPVADYRLAHTCVGEGEDAEDAGDDRNKKKPAPARACYSFCMCPGGQIVPTSTDPSELCVNGMSFSGRNSAWANSGLVSPVAFEDALAFCAEKETTTSIDGVDVGDCTDVGDDLVRETSDAALLERAPLLGLDFQRKIERAAAVMGGGDLVVPVQTAPDFLAGRLGDVSSLPKSSYRLGVKPARLDLLYPKSITEAVKESLRAFEAQMPGYAGPSALLHAPEARTSSPVRIVRAAEDGQSVTAAGLFPAGEGAGYAGGIVSAAVDGIQAAGRVLEALERD